MKIFQVGGPFLTVLKVTSNEGNVCYSVNDVK